MNLRKHPHWDSNQNSHDWDDLVKSTDKVSQAYLEVCRPITSPNISSKRVLFNQSFRSLSIFSSHGMLDWPWDLLCHQRGIAKDVNHYHQGSHLVPRFQPGHEIEVPSIENLWNSTSQWRSWECWYCSGKDRRENGMNQWRQRSFWVNTTDSNRIHREARQSTNDRRQLKKDQP